MVGEQAKEHGGLELVAMGEPRVTIDGRPISFATRHAAQALFVLAMAPTHSVAADELASFLWPDAPESRFGPRLATMLWQLRRALGGHAWRIQRSGAMVLLEMEGVSLDVTDALEGARAAKAQGHPVTVPTEAITTVLLPWADEPWVHAATIDLQVAWATLAAAETSGGGHEPTPGDDRPDRFDHSERPRA